MIRNFIFDMGNVLLRYDSVTPAARFGLSSEDTELLRQAVFLHPGWVELDRGDFSEEEYLDRIEARLPDRLKETGRLCFEEWDRYGLSPIDGMDALIRELKEKGYGIYVLSNASVRLRKYQHLFPGYDCMDGILVSAEEHCLKPEARIFHIFCERYSLRPEECFFSDDVPANIEGAKAVGMDGAVFSDTETLRRLLKERGLL